MSTLESDLRSSVFPNPEAFTAIDTRAKKRLLRLGKKHDFGSLKETYYLSLLAREILAAETRSQAQLGVPAQMHLESLQTPKERLREIAQFLLRLPMRQRLILALADRLSRPTEEVARILRLPENSLLGLRKHAWDALYEWVYQKSPPKDLLTSAAFRELTSALRATHLQPKLPIETEALPVQTRRERWKESPWYVRSGMEAVGIGLFVFLIVVLIPRVQRYYESQSQSRLESYNMAELAPGKDDEKFLTPTTDLNSTEEIAETFASGETGEEIEEGNDSPDTSVLRTLNVGRGELWRFMIRTATVRDLRSKIEKFISDPALGISAAEANGKEVPGGVQFMFLLNSDKVIAVKEKIEALLPKSALESSQQQRPPYVWFRNRARQPVPNGQTRIVIWLSQI